MKVRIAGLIALTALFFVGTVTTSCSGEKHEDGTEQHDHDHEGHDHEGHDHGDHDH